MQDEVQMGLIGCGLMGRRHVNGYKELRDRDLRVIKLTSLCDLDKKRAEDLADFAKVALGTRPEVYVDLRNMLEKEENLDAVDIVTNPPSHHILAEQAFKAGKHVIVEKPMAITVKACHKMISASEKYGGTLAVAENYRRDPLNRLVKAAIHEKVIGEPYFVLQHSIGGGGKIIVSKWRHIKEQGGILIDMGVHYADILQYFLGDVEEVYGRIAMLEKFRTGETNEGEVKVMETVQPNVEDTSLAIMKFKNGVLGQWFMSHSGYGEGMWQRLIYGEKGRVDSPPDRSGRPITITFDGGKRISGEDLLKNLAIFPPDDITPRFFPEGLSQYSLPFQEIDRRLIAIELYDFADSLINGRKPEVDGIQGLKAEALAYAICESAHLNQPVKVKDVEDGKIDNYQSMINENLSI